MEKTARLRVAYATPQTEVFAAEPYKFLAASPIGGEHNEGGDDGEITGAKDFDLDGDNSFGLDEDWGDLWNN